MDAWLYVAVVAAGFFAGFINTLAGSGSLLTLPLLMFIGLDANVANGTNRIAIFLQNVVGVTQFRKQKIFKVQEGFSLALPTLLGALVGAAIAIQINKEMMERTISILLFVMFFVILLKPSAWLKGRVAENLPKPSPWRALFFFAIGIYGGFIQAGAGIFLLAGLVLGAGIDLIKANALKLFIVLVYTPFALGLFIYFGQIDYKVGFVLAAGNMLGAFVASKYATYLGAKFIHRVLLFVIFVAAIKLMFL